MGACAGKRGYVGGCHAAAEVLREGERHFGRSVGRDVHAEGPPAVRQQRSAHTGGHLRKCLPHLQHLFRDKHLAELASCPLKSSSSDAAVSLLIVCSGREHQLLLRYTDGF